MGGGSAVVQAVGILAAPALTRLYAPADFGIMATFQAVAEICVLIATLRFDAAIPISRDDPDAARLLLLGGACVVLMSTGVLVLVVALPSSVFHFLSPDSRFYAFRWFLCFAVLGGGWYNCLVGWVTRKQHFFILSSSRVYQSFSSIGIQIGAGVMGLGLTGLIAGAFANLAGGALLLWRQTVRDLRSLQHDYRIPRFCEVAWEVQEIPNIYAVDVTAEPRQPFSAGACDFVSLWFNRHGSFRPRAEGCWNPVGASFCRSSERIPVSRCGVVAGRHPSRPNR